MSALLSVCLGSKLALLCRTGCGFRLLLQESGRCGLTRCCWLSRLGPAPVCTCQMCSPLCTLAPCSRAADLSIKRTPSRHQRMPSHEAILKVAKQHKLPPPVLTAPQQQTLAAPQRPAPQQQAVAPAAQGSCAQEPEQQEGSEAAAAADALGGSAPRPCLPVFRPASASASPRNSLEAQRRVEEEGRQQAADAAAAAYGEPWQSRKERVQAASPHGRWVPGPCGCLPLHSSARALPP